MSAARKAGRRLDVADAWIMATARQFNLILVSHDQDIVVGENIGVQIICRRKIMGKPKYQASSDLLPPGHAGL